MTFFLRHPKGFSAVCSRCGRKFKSDFLPLKGRPAYCGKCTNELRLLRLKEQKLERKAIQATARGKLKKAERLRKKEAKLKKQEL